jgi:two-component system response regulator DesR
MRIFIADESKEIRLALQMLFNQQPGMTVIGIAVSSDGVVEQIIASKPDVLLLNWNLPGDFLPDTLARLRSLMPGLKLVVLGVQFESRTAALAAGVDAFLDMSTPPHEMVEVLRRLGIMKAI